ncbi:spindle and kinetochore-associated protein 1-like [Microplitis mediator]|uniref:spindle and kinetochore-associated protein 1-like n=1 Tax=Microplitis mediator TaxID=375433 RepID=UPI002555B5DF|nr:spindle and kinetochore-associated protein 1-like [Microplitis mediator]
MPANSLEDVMKDQIKKLNDLEMATNFIRHKSELNHVLIDLKPSIDTIKINVSRFKETLDKMKEQNEMCQNLIENLSAYEKTITHMQENIPPSLKDTLKGQNETCAATQMKNKNSSVAPPKSKSESQPANPAVVIDPTEYLPYQKDCKKTLFKDSDDCYTIELLNAIEFSKIPKYMIGRQTLTNVNDFITAINQIMKLKYTLMGLGKIGARKKGELDLYLQFKKEETDIYNGKERKFFFTAEDYHREMKMKLDKTKLNILTVLRHCKRIKEVRIGKNVLYEVISGQ